LGFTAPLGAARSSAAPLASTSLRAGWRRAIAAVARAAGDESEWREAYDIEVQRNSMLREQLELLGEELGAEAALEECSVDWSDNYLSLSACNKALEQRISRAQDTGPKQFEDMRDVQAVSSAKYVVSLPDSEATETLELMPFRGKAGAFYELTIPVPLGLQLARIDSGDMYGAYIVEDIIEGGSAFASGEVVVGDLLHALTVVYDRQSLGMKSEDFVSSVVGGFGRFTQTLTDTYKVNCVDDLVEAIKTNSILGTEVKMKLVFERDTWTASPPAQPLEKLGPKFR